MRDDLGLQILCGGCSQVPFEAELSDHLDDAVTPEDVQLCNIVWWDGYVDLHEQVLLRVGFLLGCSVVCPQLEGLKQRWKTGMVLACSNAIRMYRTQKKANLLLLTDIQHLSLMLSCPKSLHLVCITSYCILGSLVLWGNYRVSLEFFIDLRLKRAFAQLSLLPQLASRRSITLGRLRLQPKPLMSWQMAACLCILIKLRFESAVDNLALLLSNTFFL